jgi:hypothetical protein
VFIKGQVNPRLAAYITDDVHEDDSNFLSQLAEKHENVILLSDELPQHAADEYDDIYHIHPDVRETYTSKLAAVPATRFGWNLQVKPPADQ